jgi:hypothetical protein
MTAAASSTRLFYVDDSGAPSTGFVVYSCIETTFEDWRTGLRAWLDLRQDLYATYKIPASVELHATNLVGGRGYPSTDPAVNASKQARSEVMQRALAAIGDAGDLRVRTVYRLTAARGSSYQAEREALYAAFIEHLDVRLELAGELGMVVMDGDGTASGYYNAHRALKLAKRRIIEDPFFQTSHRSQWVQMADLAAWTAYQALLRHPTKQFAWGWYDRHLSGADVNGGPVAL